MKPTLWRLWDLDGRWYYTVQNAIYGAADEFVTFGPFATQYVAANNFSIKALANRRCWFHNWHTLDVADSVRIAMTTAVAPLGWWVRPHLPWRQQDRICRRCGLILRPLSATLADFLDDLPASARVDTARIEIWRRAPVQIGIDVPVPR